MNTRNRILSSKRKNILFFYPLLSLFFCLLFFNPSLILSQTNLQTKTSIKKSDSIPEVYINKHFNFGEFTHRGAGGTLTVNVNGDRHATGGIIAIYLKEYNISPIVVVVTTKPGTLITNFFISNNKLHTKSGESLLLTMGKTSPQLPYITKREQTEFIIGASLQINSKGNIQMEGIYNALCSITIGYH